MYRFLLGSFLTLLLCCSFYSNTEAQPLIQVTFTSFHLDRDKDYNEFNIGIGVGYDVGPVDVSVGWYVNSHKKNTFYFAADQAWPEGNPVAVGGFVGFVTGYGKGLMPAFAPAVSVGRKDVRLRLSYIPVDKGVIAPQLKYKFPKIED